MKIPMSPIPIDEQVREIVAAVSEGASSRDIAIAVEANQEYIDYLDHLKDTLSVDESVIIQVNGTRIKFKNDDDLANWIVEQMR